MPHLKFCNRYWYVAGDELSIPALCSISIRVFWTALITTVYACSYDQLKDCNLEWILQFYLLLSISLFLLSIVCDAIIINVSLKGTITTPEERKSIGSLLVYKFGLTAAEIVCGVFGLLTLVLGSILPCNQDVENSGWTKAFVAVVVASQLADGGIVCCCFFCLQTLEKDHEELKGIEENEAVALWEARCNSLRRCVAWGFCNLFGGNNVEEGFEKVARVLTTFFHHDGFLDVVASDVVAGFILVRVEQQHRKNTQQIVHTEQPFQQMSPLRQVRNNESDVLNVSDIEVQNRLKITRNLSVELERFSLEELDNWFRCSTFALAIYTHIMFLYMNPCSGWCRLSCRSCFHNPLCDLCLFRPRAKLQHKRYNKTSFGNNVVIEGDNCCKLHYTGTKGLLDNLIDAELIHVSYKNNTIHKPFGIFLDHEKEWVVIALRGTLSLEDCVTDAYCDPVEMSEAGRLWGFDGTGRYAHGGMLKAALYIRQELEQSKIMSKLFGAQRVSSNITTPLTENGNYGNYKLIVTGHSLGAGTAVLLSWLLRSAYPTVHCYAYGTPGSVVDQHSAEEISNFVTTIVYGNDLVCRLNFQSLCKLRNDVLDTITRARVNKMMVMKAMFRNLSPDDLMYPPGQAPDSEFKRCVEKFKENIQQRSKDIVEHPLTLPGKVIHFRNTPLGVKDCCNTIPTHFPFSVAIEQFKEITVSTTMGSDHLPDRYYYGLMKVRDYYLKHQIDV